MNEVPGTRIGVAERERALRTLSHHVGTGRLSLTEFDERSAAAAAATTRAELAEILLDLPIPVTAPAERTPPNPLLRISVVTVAIVITGVLLALATGSPLWLVLLAGIPIPALLSLRRR